MSAEISLKPSFLVIMALIIYFDTVAPTYVILRPNSSNIIILFQGRKAYGLKI